MVFVSSKKSSQYLLAEICLQGQALNHITLDIVYVVNNKVFFLRLRVLVFIIICIHPLEFY